MNRGISGKTSFPKRQVNTAAAAKMVYTGSSSEKKFASTVSSITVIMYGGEARNRFIVLMAGCSRIRIAKDAIASHSFLSW